MDKRKSLGGEWVWVYEFGYVVSEHADMNNTKKWQNDFMCEKRVRGRCLARD